MYRRHTVTPSFWSTHREASLNWLAVGLLLAAWNASDDDPIHAMQQRPAVLRGYEYVSIRGAQRAAVIAHSSLR